MVRTSADTKSLGEPLRSAALDVHLLGLVDFESAAELQHRLAFELSGRDDRKGFLLICEHPPTISIGREGSVDDITASPEELANYRVDVRHSARGGGCYVHGPGQLAIYPVVPLERLGMGVQQFRRGVEAAVMQMAQEFKIPHQPASACPGIRGRVGQYAFYGVGVRNWVTQHGIYVNVTPAAGLLELVKTHGDARPSTLSAERMRPVGMASVRSSLAAGIAEALGYSNYHVFTGHPWLRRNRQVVYAFS